jgi:hypothetical protein
MAREDSMWRGPLDELIETLETTLPVATKHDRYELLPRFDDFVMVCTPLSYGSAEDRERIQRDPRITG